MGPTAAVLLLLVKPLAACCASHCVRVANAYYLYRYVLGIMLAKSCQLGQRKEGGGGLELKNFHPLK